MASGVYIVPPFGTYFSAITFSLTCGLHSAGCRTTFALASDVCPLVGEVGPGACAGFLPTGKVPAHWRIELGLAPVMGSAKSLLNHV